MKGKLVVKREFSLYYILAILYGGRKQLFLTFGPWMLVDLYRQPVSTMTALFFAVSVLGIFVKPAVGRLIDGRGERFVLGAEAVLITFVCLVYAFARDLLPPGLALAAVACSYVIDQSSNAVSMARATYVKKVALHAEDVSPTLSVGISIDHLVSMTIPMLGGLVWRSSGSTGYRWVFLGGAVICLVNFAATRFIKTKAA
jgi:MFS family permease